MAMAHQQQEPVPDMVRSRRSGMQPPWLLPHAPQVRTFVMYFYRHIREKNGAAASRCVGEARPADGAFAPWLRPPRAVYEILSMYETSFAVITDKYFKASAWPPVEAVAPFVGFDAVFLLLYRELYYRHSTQRGRTQVGRAVAASAATCLTPRPLTQSSLA